MVTFIIVIVIAIVFFLIKDQFDRSNEINKDSSLANGLKNKYPKVFKYFQNDGFNILKESKAEVQMQRVFSEINLFMNCDIRHELGNRLHVIVQYNSIIPRRYISSKSFFYSSTLPEEKLIEYISADISNTFQSVLK